MKITLSLFFSLCICFAYCQTAKPVKKPASTNNTVTDADGNKYNTVTIGTQTWMKENLKTTKYKDNTDIPLGTRTALRKNLKAPVYCNYNNTTNSDTINTYGRLYNWYTVNTNNLCPTGWHVPTIDDWMVFDDYLSQGTGYGYRTTGGRMKESGTSHWLAPNTGAVNDSKFTALPGGFLYDNGKFENIGREGFWWSSTEDTMGTRLVRVAYDNWNMLPYDGKKFWGCSVRCLKD